jgi:hypothetical protein
MMVRKSITWPQICDGKGSTELVRLFNAATPTYFVLDRNGAIVSKHAGALGLEKIRGTLSELLSRRSRHSVAE